MPEAKIANTSIEIHGCPFCMRRSTDVACFVMGEGSYYVWCRCEAQGPRCETPEIAIQLWNEVSRPWPALKDAAAAVAIRKVPNGWEATIRDVPRVGVTGATPGHALQELGAQLVARSQKDGPLEWQLRLLEVTKP